MNIAQILSAAIRRNANVIAKTTIAERNGKYVTVSVTVKDRWIDISVHGADSKVIVDGKFRAKIDGNLRIRPIGYDKIEIQYFDDRVVIPMHKYGLYRVEP